MNGSEPVSGGIRLDKWLWAARFYKTRSLAKQAIEGGKVQYDGARCKVSKEVQIDAKLSINIGFDTKIITVINLSSQRRGAPEAAMLYQETANSIHAREQQAADRKALGAAGALRPERPNKKQRRQIHRFKQQD
ncbi:MAG: ribosome-associated heat shock protein Hsp15 [Zhongshania sp.]|jgi:ribosome-associated heat shock protein Hsp15